MKIIGFNLSKILIEKKEKLIEKLDITQNIDIKDIKEENISLAKDRVLKINFTFIIDYSEDFAKLEFEGFILIIPEKNELKEILNLWKDKKISDNTKIPLFNFIINKCNIKALSFEDEFNLPPHVPLPRLTPKKE